MAKKKSKADKKSKGKKNKKNKNDIADMGSKAIGNLARKSTKKLNKSLEKRTGSLVSKITPSNLLAAALENAGKQKNSGNNETKQNVAALPDSKQVTNRVQ